MTELSRKSRGSTSGRPITVLLDVLGQRSTLRILWELRSGPLTFRALDEACGGLSPTLLNGRLKRLRRLHLVEHIEGCGYALTRDGTTLGELLVPLNRWAERWEKKNRTHD